MCSFITHWLKIHWKWDLPNMDANAFLNNITTLYIDYAGINTRTLHNALHADKLLATLSSCDSFSCRGYPWNLLQSLKKVPEGYIAFVEELPGANAQGAPLEEARENIREAIELVLEANRVLAEESIQGRQVVKERIVAAA